MSERTPRPLESARTALVTGSLGFLGRYVCGRLRRNGISVLGLDRTNSEAESPTLAVDLRDAAAVRDAVAEVPVTDVFHLAAAALEGAARDAPGETFEVNVRGTWNLLEALRSTGRRPRLVLASTVAARGARATEAAIASPYRVSKACAEMIAESYYESAGFPVGIVRLGNLYGPGDLTPSRIIPGTVLDVLAGKRPQIRSDGSPRRRFLYVEDAVDALVATADALAAEPPSVLRLDAIPTDEMSVLELVERILVHLDREDLRPRILGTAGAESSGADVASRNDVAWTARTRLDAGLRETCRWFQGRVATASPEEKR